MLVKFGHSKQNGIAAIVVLTILVLGSTYYLLERLNNNNLKIERDKKTAMVLAMAKEAVIGRAAASPNTPGLLSCPQDPATAGGALDGQAPSSCSTSVTRIGLLPWKTLGLPDIRDGNGDRIWYAISNGFNVASNSLNSDKIPTLSVDGVTGNVVAILFSPGASLSGQIRSASPITIADYLDGSNNTQTDTYISTSTSTFNDRLLLVTHDDLFKVVEKVIAKTTLDCLTQYAALTANKGHYPWAANLDTTQAPQYNDKDNVRFGRIPESLANTQITNSGMTDWSPTSCNFSKSGSSPLPTWWQKWNALVFYAVADVYKPVAVLTIPPGNACTVGICLTIDPPSATANKQVIVIVAGRRLSTQLRTSNIDTGTLSNYLENTNSAGSDSFTQLSRNTGFNDTLVYCYTDASTGGTKCWPQ